MMDSIERLPRDDDDVDAPDVIVVKTERSATDTSDGDTTNDNIQETDKDRSRRRLVDRIKFSDLYIRKYWDGRLKVLEGLSTFLAVIILPPDYHYFIPRFIFFRFVCATSLIFVLMDLFLHLSSLWERLPKYMTASNVLMLFNILAAMSLAACSSLVVGVAEFSGAELSDTLIASIAGFASMLFFGIESFLHLIRYRTSVPITTYRAD